MQKDPYEALGVNPESSSEEIKAAYRKAAKRTHPDQGGDPDEFKAIASAFEILSDPAKRRRFDECGESQKPRLEQMIAGLVLSAFAQKEKNPVQWMCDAIDRQRDEHSANLRLLVQKKRDLQAAADRFAKQNATSENVVAVDLIIKTLNRHIDGLENAKQFEQEEVEFGTAMLTFLNGLDRGPQANRRRFILEGSAPT